MGAGLPAKHATRCMAPASPVFAGKPAPTGSEARSRAKTNTQALPVISSSLGSTFPNKEVFVQCATDAAVPFDGQSSASGSLRRCRGICGVVHDEHVNPDAGQRLPDLAGWQAAVYRP
ncbi:hypothetical protein AL532_20735 [Pseudomonas monteilii]|nr:hypothetical protein AL532_20735 [Pseudomonas monteilii]